MRVRLIVNDRAICRGRTVVDDLLRSKIGRNGGFFVDGRVLIPDGRIVVDEQLQKADVLHWEAIVEMLHEDFVVESDFAILILHSALGEEENMASDCMIEQLGVSTVVKDLLEDLAWLPDTAAFQLQLAFFHVLLGHFGGRVVRHAVLGKTN